MAKVTNKQLICCAKNITENHISCSVDNNTNEITKVNVNLSASQIPKIKESWKFVSRVFNKIIPKDLGKKYKPRLARKYDNKSQELTSLEMMKEFLNNAVDDMKQFIHELNTQKEEVLRKKKEMKDLQEEVDEMEKEIELANKENERITKLIEEETNKLNQYKSVNQQLKEENNKLNEKVTTMKNECKEMQESVNVYEEITNTGMAVVDKIQEDLMRNQVSDENRKNDYLKNEIPGYDFFTFDEWLEWCAGLDDHFVTKETLMEIVNELDESFD